MDDQLQGLEAPKNRRVLGSGVATALTALGLNGITNSNANGGIITNFATPGEAEATGAAMAGPYTGAGGGAGYVRYDYTFNGQARSGWSSAIIFDPYTAGISGHVEAGIRPFNPTFYFGYWYQLQVRPGKPLQGG